jgi:hypothetical protein
LRFGYDISTGCVLNLDRSQLEAFCCTGSNNCQTRLDPSPSPYSNPLSGLPHFFEVTPGYIGIFGNADPLDINQWLELISSVPVPTRTFDRSTGICSNMFTGLNYKFLVSKSGERINPQNKIVAAIAEVTTGDLLIRVPYGDVTTTQSFPLTVTVSFIETNSQQLKGYFPPAPPVLFQVPYDVFYPFFQSSHSCNNPTGILSIFVPIIAFLYFAFYI